MCLLWADDLVLWSWTREGAQKQLDTLKQYADENKLTVYYIEKTESMFVCTNKSVPYGPYPSNVLIYNNVPIRNVSKYKYVGAWVDRFGSTDPQFNYVLNSARKAMYACMSRVSSLCVQRMPYVYESTYV